MIHPPGSTTQLSRVLLVPRYQILLTVIQFQFNQVKTCTLAGHPRRQRLNVEEGCRERLGLPEKAEECLRKHPSRNLWITGVSAGCDALHGAG